MLSFSTSAIGMYVASTIICAKYCALIYISNSATNWASHCAFIGANNYVKRFWESFNVDAFQIDEFSLD